MLITLVLAVLPAAVHQIGEYLRARSQRAHDARVASLEERVAVLEEMAGNVSAALSRGGNSGSGVS